MEIKKEEEKNNENEVLRKSLKGSKWCSIRSDER